jgi:hypothetical protein
MKESHLRLAKELIEIKTKERVGTIEFEDGSGSTFIYTIEHNPHIKKFIRL